MRQENICVFHDYTYSLPCQTPCGLSVDWLIFTRSVWARYGEWPLSQNVVSGLSLLTRIIGFEVLLDPIVSCPTNSKLPCSVTHITCKFFLWWSRILYFSVRFFASNHFLSSILYVYVYGHIPFAMNDFYKEIHLQIFQCISLN